ncbi:MAG: NADH-quinone oxidoreductase subunit NuoH [Acidimicrobiales bacterium]
MDPLFLSGLSSSVVLAVLLKVVITFVFLLIATMLMVWFERKVHADMTNRLGPNRAGPFGILQTLADGMKLFFKEGLMPDRAEPGVYKLAPYLSFVPAFVTFAIIPVGGVFANGGHDGTIASFLGHTTFAQLADPPIGILVFLAMSAIAVYGVMLAGWSSGSKYPLLGAVRATAQMVSYEAALGLSIVMVVLATGTLSTHRIVEAQSHSFTDWNVWQLGVVPFLIFLIAGTAELNRPPFDLVEAEQELVAGAYTEYSSIRFALFFLAEFMNVITMSAIIVTLFFGGPSGPLLLGPDWIWPLVWFFAKLTCFLYVFVWFRATLPRFRYDQLMDLGWKVLIPLSLGWLLLVSAIKISGDESWNPVVVATIGAATIVAAFAVLRLAVRTGAQRRRFGELEG